MGFLKETQNIHIDESLKPMSFWTEIHWSEGMFLRPHHLQANQRRMETVVSAGFDAVRPFGWGFTHLEIAKEPLENATIRLDRCAARLKDGTQAATASRPLLATATEWPAFSMVRTANF